MGILLLSASIWIRITKLLLLLLVSYLIIMLEPQSLGFFGSNYEMFKWTYKLFRATTINNINSESLTLLLILTHHLFSLSPLGGPMLLYARSQKFIIKINMRSYEDPIKIASAVSRLLIVFLHKLAEQRSLFVVSLTTLIYFRLFFLCVTLIIVSFMFLYIKPWYIITRYMTSIHNQYTINALCFYILLFQFVIYTLLWTSWFGTLFEPPITPSYGDLRASIQTQLMRISVAHPSTEFPRICPCGCNDLIYPVSLNHPILWRSQVRVSLIL